jgi:hypothetical protein
MILVDEMQLSVALLCEMLIELGYEPLRRGYTDEEKAEIIANITAIPVSNEKDAIHLEAALKTIDEMQFLDSERMVDEYIGELRVEVE